MNGKRIAGPGHVDFVEDIDLGNYRFGLSIGNLSESKIRMEESYGTGKLEYESVIRKY